MTRSHSPDNCHPPGPLRLRRLLRAAGLQSTSAAGSAIQAMGAVEEGGSMPRVAALLPSRLLDLIWAVLPTLLLRRECESQDHVVPIPRIMRRSFPGKRTFEGRNPPRCLCENRVTVQESDKPLLQTHFKKIDRCTMDKAYGVAFARVAEALREGGQVLACRAANCGAPSPRT